MAILRSFALCMNMGIVSKNMLLKYKVKLYTQIVSVTYLKSFGVFFVLYTDTDLHSM